MGHVARLLLVGRATECIGRLALLCGALLHIKVGEPFFMSISLTERNLLEEHLGQGREDMIALVFSILSTSRFSQCNWPSLTLFLSFLSSSLSSHMP